MANEMPEPQLSRLWRNKKQLRVQAEDILDKAERESRDLRPSERRKVDEKIDRIEDINEQIGNFFEDGGNDQPSGREAFVGVSERDYLDGRADTGAPSVHTSGDKSMTQDSNLSQETRERWDAFVRYGAEGERPETREAQQSVGVAAEGGVFSSTELAGEFLRIQQKFGGVRDTRARQMRTQTGEAMNVPFVDDVDESAEQVAENSTVTSVNRVDFGDVQLQAHTFDSGVVTVSREQVQDSQQDVAQIVQNSLANRIGRAVEPDLAGSTVTTSTAINGIITLSSGAETIGAGSTNLDIQNLRNLYFSVDPVFRSQGEWAVSDNAMQAIMDLEDADGEPLIQPSLQEGEPPRLLGRPIRRVVGLGDIAASTEKPVLFGDFREGYVVRDVMRTEIVRYDEKFMPSRRIGFQAFQRVDGRPLLSSTVSSTNLPYRALRTT